jgi:hypothetical protein
MTGSLDYPNLISSAHCALNDDSQVRARSHRLGEAARKDRIVHPNSKSPARDPWLGNLKNGGPDLPTLSDERMVHLYAFRREVFAKLAVCKRSADLLFPPPCVFDGICVDGFIGSPMRLSVCLVVSVEVDASSGDPTGDR